MSPIGKLYLGLNYEWYNHKTHRRKPRGKSLWHEILQWILRYKNKSISNKNNKKDKLNIKIKKFWTLRNIIKKVKDNLRYGRNVCK